MPINYGGPLAYCMGRLQSILGVADEALPLYEEALESAEALGARPMLARIQLDASRLFARVGDKQRARALLASGASLANELGMPSLTASAERLS